MVSRFIRKFRGGGHLAPNDPAIPTANVHIYARSRYGDSFQLLTLEEGLMHLLSNEGYRLSIWEYPGADEAEMLRGRAGITLTRDGEEIATVIHSEYNEWDTGGVKNIVKIRSVNTTCRKGRQNFDCDFDQIVIDGS